MTRVPQLILTLTPNDEIVAECTGANGARRHVPIESLYQIRQILSARLSQTPSTIGMDAQPTTAQVRHWHDHEEAGTIDLDCSWCIASEMGIDTSRAAFLRARRILLAERARHSHKPDPSLHTAGDGSVKVRHLPSRSKHLSPSTHQIPISLSSFFD
jgi:hypothetical protein